MNVVMGVHNQLIETGVCLYWSLDFTWMVTSENRYHLGKDIYYNNYINISTDRFHKYNEWTSNDGDPPISITSIYELRII